ncbi:MAG: DEAD/DEAH box helicase [Acidobacteriota bacterium]
MTDSFSMLHADLRRGIADLGFDQPTPIQRKAIPPALEGRDVLACAMTGSGKTAAFLLPILHQLIGRKKGTTRALVLSPTRELAAQIVDHFNALSRHTRLRAMAVYGGVGMYPQEQAFRRGVDVIVACPGRLLDHFSRPHGRLPGLEFLVLDEADRMLDMGFLPDIRRILGHLPAVSQTLFFSATLPRPVVELADDMLDNPVRLDVERRSTPATKISQSLFPVRQEQKADLLMALLEDGVIGNGLVFTRTKHRADRLARKLSRRGVSCDRIHGDRTQGQRTRALADFKKGRTRILVATDIAARGIDVEALSHVVNFDVPHVPEDYIHRVGRTARAQATGEAFTFVAPAERASMHNIERAVGQQIQRRQVAGFDVVDMPVTELRSTRDASRRSSGGGGQGRPARHKDRPFGAKNQGGAKKHGGSKDHGGSRHQGPKSGPRHQSKSSHGPRHQDGAQHASGSRQDGANRTHGESRDHRGSRDHGGPREHGGSREHSGSREHGGPKHGHGPKKHRRASGPSRQHDSAGSRSSRGGHDSRSQRDAGMDDRPSKPKRRSKPFRPGGANKPAKRRAKRGGDGRSSSGGGQRSARR